MPVQDAGARTARRVSGDDLFAAILVQRQVLSPTEAQRLLEECRKTGAMVEEALLAQGLATAADLRAVLEDHFFCPSIDLGAASLDERALRLVSPILAARHLAVPVGFDEQLLEVAFADPDNARACDAITHASGHQVVRFVALRHQIRDAVAGWRDRLARSPGLGSGQPPAGPAPARQTRPTARTGAAARIELPADFDASAVVNATIEGAVRQRATDIHVEPWEERLVIRFRVDGTMREVASLPRALTASVTSRMKVMGAMDISERRLPQDGRATVEAAGKVVDLRLSSLPSRHGEKVVARLLLKDSNLLSLDAVAMPSPVRARWQQALDDPMGLFLVTGPTGSGKTTTLYATLAGIDRATSNVITLEDPIEYTLPGVTQVQVNEAAGMTFAAGLRSILRQDPDTILVGEMRDQETAEIACRAALTGHKVLSTLHANDACQAVTRLLDMGLAPHLLTATLRASLAQRLLRRNCAHCKVGQAAGPADLALLGHPRVEPGWRLQRGAGCPECAGTGYSGRMAVFEAFKLDDACARLVLERGSPVALRMAAQRAGMITMGETVRRLVVEGHASLEEARRVVLADEGREQVCGRCQRVVSVDYATCPYCQHVLKEHCEGCRTPLDAHWQACPTCGQEIDREWRGAYCGRCSAELPEGAGECPFCGEAPA